MPVIKEFEHLRIPLVDIKSATNDFNDSNCIGKGGFGDVYKGNLIRSEKPTTVAVKRLDRKFGQGDPEFWKEILMLSSHSHENIVSLLGFCDDESTGEKMIVYEYVSNQSLDKHLKRTDLTWIQRLKICIGAARGFEYLHDPKGTQQRILHRDIKSSNILLDEYWNAKISDFGLSKIGRANQKYTFAVTRVVGTPGYWDPLYAMTGLLTKESDVYSFGVVLFEVLCGRLCTDNSMEKSQHMVRLARQCFQDNKLNEIVYDPIKKQMNPDSLKAYATVAYQCLKTDREERPTMTQIVKQLEIALQSLVCPFVPFLVPLKSLAFIDYMDDWGGHKFFFQWHHPLDYKEHHIYIYIDTFLQNLYWLGEFSSSSLATSNFSIDIFGRHGSIEPTNDYHKHTRTHASPAVSGIHGQPTNPSLSQPNVQP